MENLANNEDYVKLRHVLSLLGKRIIPGYLYSKYPDTTLIWQWNSCRQTAMVVCYYLKYIVFPDRTVSMYEANFTDPILDDAVHAFCFLRPSEEDKYGLLIDVSRVSYPVIVERMTEMRDPGIILSNKMGYEIKMEKLVELDWRMLMEKTEYFSGERYINFCKKIVDLLAVTEFKTKST